MRFALNAPFVTSFVTNWMTAAGIALIAGGLATLISFRSVLFGAGAGERRRARRAARASRARRGRPVAPRDAIEPEAAVPDPGPTSRRAQGNRRRAPVEAVAVPDDRHGGLASIGLADDEEEPEEVVEDEVEEEAAPIPVRRIDRSDRAYGDRVDGWVRPQYGDEPPAGEYWTPVPIELAVEEDERYGWPVPVERLPPVPPYEPATGFDLTPVPAEPTEVVPSWPPVPGEGGSRIRLPRSWTERDEKPRDEQPKRRRPRPRPRPHPDTEVDRSTVYVSRHAADPPR